jgi:hypothetical protein
MGVAAKEAERTADVLIGGQANVVGVARGGSQDGLAGTMREVAGAAFATAAGWAGGEAAVALVAAFLPLSAGAAVAVGVVAGVVAAYIAGKEVVSGIDAFNDWRNQAAERNAPIAIGLDNDVTVTVNPDHPSLTVHPWLLVRRTSR